MRGADWLRIVGAMELIGHRTPCCVCSCGVDKEVVACFEAEDGNIPNAECQSLCGDRVASIPCEIEIECSTLSQCPATAPAPTASPYGIAALLIALGGFGAWRLSRRAAA